MLKIDHRVVMKTQVSSHNFLLWIVMLIREQNLFISSFCFGV
jgi:hypothetical protein